MYNCDHQNTHSFYSETIYPSTTPKSTSSPTPTPMPIINYLSNIPPPRRFPSTPLHFFLNLPQSPPTLIQDLLQPPHIPRMFRQQHLPRGLQPCHVRFYRWDDYWHIMGDLVGGFGDVMCQGLEGPGNLRADEVRRRDVWPEAAEVASRYACACDGVGWLVWETDRFW